MTKATLEAALRERLNADPRALIGSLDIQHDRILLHFGAIGALSRIVFVIDENEVSVAEPVELRKAWNVADEEKRSRTPLDPAKPLSAHYEDGKLYAAKSGPEIVLPDAFLSDLKASLAPAAEPAKETGSPAASGEAAQEGKGDDGSTPANDASGSGGAPEAIPEWIDFEKHKLDALKALAQAEGVELAPEDGTKREIAAKINAKRGAKPPAE